MAAWAHLRLASQIIAWVSYRSAIYRTLLYCQKIDKMVARLRKVYAEDDRDEKAYAMLKEALAWLELLF